MPKSKTPRRDPRFKGPVTRTAKKAGVSKKKAKSMVREGNAMYRMQSPTLKQKPMSKVGKHLTKVFKKKKK